MDFYSSCGLFFVMATQTVILERAGLDNFRTAMSKYYDTRPCVRRWVGKRLPVTVTGPVQGSASSPSKQVQKFLPEIHRWLLRFRLSHRFRFYYRICFQHKLDGLDIGVFV